MPDAATFRRHAALDDTDDRQPPNFEHVLHGDETSTGEPPPRDTYLQHDDDEQSHNRRLQ